MKVLHVIAQLPFKTGSGVYFSNMVEGFKKYNYKQKAIFARQDGLDWNILDEEDQYPVEFKSASLPFPIVGMSNVMPYDNTLYSDMDEDMVKKWKAEFIGQLEKAKREFEPDLIFAHHLWMLSSSPIYFPIFSLLTGSGLPIISKLISSISRDLYTSRSS